MRLEDYPELFREADHGFGLCRFSLLDSLPPHDLISNINLVPFVGEECVIIQVLYPQGPIWDIPGGTLEPGESYMDAIRREVWEEAGAQLRAFKPFGAWYCRSLLDGPYRPHLPYPDYYRLVGYGDIVLLDAPQSVEGGEKVVSVECVAVDEAARRMYDSGQGFLAELYLLAAYLRANDNPASSASEVTNEQEQQGE